jgi:anti-sigma factor RsiW
MSHLDDSTLNEYLDSALTPDRRADAGRHLAACRECAARLDRMQALFAALDSLPDLQLERDLAPGVLSSVRKSELGLRPTAPAVLTAVRGSGFAERPRLRLLFAVQAILALVLLAAAIRLALQNLTVPDLSQVSDAQVLTLSGLYLSMLEEWNAVLAGAGRFLATGLATRPDLPLPSLPTFGLALIVLAAGLLWLVGNGVLLKQVANSRRRSAFSRE